VPLVLQLPKAMLEKRGRPVKRVRPVRRAKGNTGTTGQAGPRDLQVVRICTRLTSVVRVPPVRLMKFWFLLSARSGRRTDIARWEGHLLRRVRDRGTLHATLKARRQKRRQSRLYERGKCARSRPNARRVPFMHRRKARPVVRRIVPVAVAASALRPDPCNLVTIPTQDRQADGVRPCDEAKP
jgi:hypothetical protein